MATPNEASRLARVIALRTKDAAQLTTQEWAWAAKDADVPTPVSQITRQSVIELMSNEGVN